MLPVCEQVPEEALAHSFVTCSSVMATSYNAKASAMARRNVRKDAYRLQSCATKGLCLKFPV